MELNLNGKVALITGASRGLGFAAAHALSMEGCKTAINSRNELKIVEAATKIQDETRQEVLPISGDVTNANDVIRIVQNTIEHYGKLDILITNAGGPPPGRFENLNDEDWGKAFELTFLSQVRLIRAALPYLRKSSAASVLTVTSYSVKQPIENLILSNSIRAATVGLTKSLSQELGSAGIRFNSILPGWTETERVTELMSARAAQNHTSIEQEIAKQMKESPLGRMAQPVEFGKVAAFLVSPAASYITGVLLPIDGGMIKGTY